jgi:hypothetical protein
MAKQLFGLKMREAAIFATVKASWGPRVVAKLSAT